VNSDRPVVACLTGDGVGPEVVAEAKRVIDAVASVELVDMPFGASAIREHGDPLPKETIAACREADAVLKGPVGDPEFDDAEIRPEDGALRLRAELDVYANLRPAVALDGERPVDMMIVRELVGGLYYGSKGVRDDGTVYDTCDYHPDQVERVLRRSFELARERRGKLTSVDKANMLETSRMWRRLANDLAFQYEGVAVDHMYVDNAAMQIVRAPEQFDVVVTENIFGDILSNIAAEVSGGIGLAPSASLSDDGPGVFEPVHGSAPDIAGRGIVNPAATLRTVALMFAHGLDDEETARNVEAAVERALAEAPTVDLGGEATTREFGDAVLRALA
jgi:3-isopropylmalate dehydrogenase